MDKRKINTPVVFVPGIMGSQLWNEAQSGCRMWPFWDWKDGELRFNTSDLLDVSTPKFASGLFPDIYEGLLYALKGMGYVLNHNFWVFEYDWTQSNQVSGKKLSCYIQEKVLDHWRSADVICHSMGGLVVRAARKLFDARIRRCIFLASPHFGSPTAYFALNTKIGFNFFSQWHKNLVTRYVWKKYIRQDQHDLSISEYLKSIASKIQSIYELLPDSFYLTENRPMVITETGMDKPVNSTIRKIPVLGTDDTYFNNQLTSFVSEEQRERVQKAMKFKESLASNFSENDLIIYSNTVNTHDSIEYFEIYKIDGDSLGASGRYSGWRRPFDSGQGGDGTVPTHSSTADNANVIRVQGTHLSIPNYHVVHKIIREFLIDA